MEWAGPVAALWTRLTALLADGLATLGTPLAGWQREPWFAGLAAVAVVVLLLWSLWLGLAVRRLSGRLAADTAATRTLFHAILTTRAARIRAAGLQGSLGGAGSGRGGRRRSGGAQQPVRPAGPEAPIVAPDAELCHVKIYVDYSNLILNWRRTDQAGVDWDQLPPVILRILERMPVCAGKRVVYCGTHVYGSYYPAGYYDLLDTIENGSARSITVPFQTYKRQRMREDADKSVPAHQADRTAEIGRIVTARLRQELTDWRGENAAETDLLARSLPNKFGYVSFPFERRTPSNLRTAHYTSDGVPIAHEKGLDVRCCTDLMADGAFDIFDVAVIVSNDSDFVPAVSFVAQELGKPVIQLGPRAISDMIRAASTGHINLEDVIALVNANRGGATPTPRPAPAPSAGTPVTVPSARTVAAMSATTVASPGVAGGSATGGPPVPAQPAIQQPAQSQSQPARAVTPRPAPAPAAAAPPPPPAVPAASSPAPGAVPTAPSSEQPAAVQEPAPSSGSAVLRSAPARTAVPSE